jgi:tRNA(Ile2)-agmatinylcytidine synthase
LRAEYSEVLEQRIKETGISLIEECADISFKGTDPGIVFLTTSEVPREIKTFAKKAETGIVTLREAVRLIQAHGAEALGFNTCRGVIGALAAIGETLTDDHTYELIAYRTPENCGSKRRVDELSIFEMDRLTQPYTFNNVDLKKHRVVITPRGPDPILLGIRGETPEIVKKAFEMVKPLELVERWVVFRTNQGTDSHLNHMPSLGELKPYHSVVARGIVSQSPRMIALRHVIFSISDVNAEVDCAAYEPTGDLRKAAKELITGDKVEVYGAVRKSSASELLTINLEKIDVVELGLKKVTQNPNCPVCKKRLESMGRNKGFRCKKCGARFRDFKKVEGVEERKLKPALYVTSAGSQRHVTKPLRRYGLEKHHAETRMIEEWHSRM